MYENSTVGFGECGESVDRQRLGGFLSGGASLFAPLDLSSYQECCADVGFGLWLEEVGGALSFPVYEVTRNAVFVPGMPLAAPPVESLYKRWSGDNGASFSAAEGLYRGDSALHVQHLYQTLGIQIPDEYRATPDHLTLLVELFLAFEDGGNHEAAVQFADDHLDWISAYGETLASRATDVLGAEGLTSEHRITLHEGIQFYVALTGALTRVIGIVKSLDA